MNPSQKKWIDGATHQELIDLIRNEPVESEWFEGATGDYIFEALKRIVCELCSQDEGTVSVFLAQPQSTYVSPDSNVDPTVSQSAKRQKKGNVS